MSRAPQPTTPQAAQTERAERARLHWLWATLRDDGKRHRLLFGVGLVALGIVGVLGYLSYRNEVALDLWVTRELQGPQAALIRNGMYAISLPGYSPWSALLVVGMSLLVGWRLHWRDGGFLALITALQGLSNHLIKTAIGRPRPAADLVEVFLPNSGNSFPSGHVMFYTVFFGFLFFLAWSRLPQGWLRALALISSAAMVLLVGPSRIYLGAHWFTDVIAAHLVALVILLFAIEFYIARVAPSRRQIAQQAVAPEAAQL